MGCSDRDGICLVRVFERVVIECLGVVIANAIFATQTMCDAHTVMVRLDLWGRGSYFVHSGLMPPIPLRSVRRC